jgi:hypothetical protein
LQARHLLVDELENVRNELEIARVDTNALNELSAQLRAAPLNTAEQRFEFVFNTPAGFVHTMRKYNVQLDMPLVTQVFDNSQK